MLEKKFVGSLLFLVALLSFSATGVMGADILFVSSLETNAPEPDPMPADNAIKAFFESLGVLVRMGLLDISILQKWSPEACIWFWEKTKPIILEARKRLKAQGRQEYNIWENAEYLYNKLKQREQALLQTQQ